MSRAQCSVLALRLLVLVLPVLSLSCGKAEPYVDPVLKPFLDQFFREAEKRNLKISGRVSAQLVGQALHGNGGDNLIAQCDSSSSSDENSTISVSRTFWEETVTDEVARRATVFHELGHCVLKRDHTTATKKLDSFHEIPVSIMYPRAFVSINAVVHRYYVEHEKEYIDELFGMTPNTAASTLASG